MQLVSKVLVALALALLCATPGSSRSPQQTQHKSERVGTPDATSRSIRIEVPGSGGCAPFVYQPTRDAFNYTAYLGLQTPLPRACKAGDIRVTKMFTNNVCIKTRANNYGNASLGSTNEDCDTVRLGNNAICKQVFAEGPADAVLEGPSAGDLIDTDKVCWRPRTVYFFVANDCAADVSVTIKTTFDTYSGSCGSSSSGGLSAGAKAGITIGILLAAALFLAFAWFCCCQLRG